MTDKVTASVELEFTGGERISNLLEFSLQQDFTDPLDRLSFSYAQRGRERELRALFRPGELCRCFINGVLQCTNIITEVDERGGSDGVMFDVTAESFISVAMEGDVDPTLSKRFKEGTKISEVIKQVMLPFGLFTNGAELDVASKDDVAARAGRSVPGGANNISLANLKEKELVSRIGQKAYPFCSWLASRHGGQIRTTNTGQLALVKPNYNQQALYNIIQGSTGVAGSRVLANPGLSIRKTNKGLFSHYLVRGHKRDGDKVTRANEPYAFFEVPGASLPDTAPFQSLKREQLPDTRANYRPGIASYKPKYWRDDEATDRDRCRAKGTIMHGVRASAGFVVTVTVDGFISHTGALWTFDTIARVVLADHEIDEDMWVRSATKTDNKRSGQTTTITLIPKGSLVLGDQ